LLDVKKTARITLQLLDLQKNKNCSEENFLGEIVYFLD
jgi:hypothetical protein